MFLSPPRCLLLVAALLSVGAVIPTHAADEGDAAGESVSPKEYLVEDLRLDRTVEAPAETSVEQVKAAVLQSLEARRWLVHVKDEPDRVIAFYARQPVMVALTVKLQPGKIELWVQGQGPAAKLHKKESQWLANLARDVADRLSPAPAEPSAGSGD